MVGLPARPGAVVLHTRGSLAPRVLTDPEVKPIARRGPVARPPGGYPMMASMSTDGGSTSHTRQAHEVPETTVTPVLVADLLAEGERMPVYVHVIDHPEGRVLVDTGMTHQHPAVADMDPRLNPLSAQADFDLAGVDIVVNTHLHFDHCGGNHLFAGRPTYVQRQELDDARSKDDYTIREWVEAADVEYVPVDGELELLPGVRLVPTPGHTPARRWSSSKRAGGRSSSPATRRSSSPSSTSPAPRANDWSVRSTPTRSGSPTSTSRGGRRRTSRADRSRRDDSCHRRRCRETGGTTGTPRRRRRRATGASRCS
jgi:N-acyl homoserine lactone hydrolase